MVQCQVQKIIFYLFNCNETSSGNVLQTHIFIVHDGCVEVWNDARGLRIKLNFCLQHEHFSLNHVKNDAKNLDYYFGM